ncbi:MAG: chemotaxis protein CheX, partial [Acidobacteriota bacterium]
ALVDLTQVGTLCLRFSPTLARRSAAAMFDSDPAELAEDELCDALGELANVAGGAVKAAAAGDVALSLPRVTLGLAPRRAAETRLATVFSCEDELLEVVLLHPQPALEEVPA